MFLLDNDYQRIKKVIEGGNVEKVELSSEAVVFHFADKTVLEIEHTTYDGLEIKAYQK